MFEFVFFFFFLFQTDKAAAVLNSLEKLLYDTSKQSSEVRTCTASRVLETFLTSLQDSL